jgi:hypothetical protein
VLEQERTTRLHPNNLLFVENATCDLFSTDLQNKKKQ